MAAFYMLAGVNHFLHPLYYQAIMPPYLPSSLTLIYISGICEMLFGVLLIPKMTRRIAAQFIILLLIAVFPANVQMVINYVHAHDAQLWIAIVRLPIQLLLIGWAWIYTKKPKS